jgi:hypothetical protein
MRASAGKVRMTRGRRCFDPEELLLMVAMPRKHTLRAFAMRGVVND